MDQYQQLEKFVKSIVQLDEASFRQLAEIWVPCSEKRKTILTYAGNTERYLYFVTEGVQRVYYSDEQGREATIVFTYPLSFAGVADSFLTQTPSKFFAETLTPSVFLKTNFLQLNELMQQNRNIEKLISIATNYAFAGVLERMVEIQCFSAEEKFNALLKRSPHLLHLIPHKYIANYLGMDATNFSKLLGKKSL
jgi:CRP-like cAMP-binding protein